MNGNPQLDAMKARLTEIGRQIDELEREAGDLEVAIKVFERYDELQRGPISLAKLGPPRPEGTPTLFEMTEAILHEAIAAGKPGLTGAQIVDAIGRKYWPGVQRPQVLPPIYQFAKKGRLAKTNNGLFRLVEREKGAQ